MFKNLKQLHPHWAYFITILVIVIGFGYYTTLLHFENRFLKSPPPSQKIRISIIYAEQKIEKGMLWTTDKRIAEVIINKGFIDFDSIRTDMNFRIEFNSGEER